MMGVGFGKRALVLGLVAVVFAVSGALLFGKRGESGEGVDELQLRASLVGLRRSLCEFQGLVAAGDVGQAKNFYWDRVHDGTHLLATAVGRTDRSVEARFLEAHAKVERGLSMLAPSLKNDVPPFVVLARASLKKLDVVGADLPC
jgi:hypothetical protein